MERKVEEICAISASYILNKSSKPGSLPETGGRKFFKSDNSIEQKESLRASYNQLHTLLNEERVVKKSSLSVGDWDAENRVAIVHTVKGSHWRHFGRKVSGKETLLPEECLFLIDQGLFELWNKGIPQSLQESYALLIPEMPSAEYYRVYAFLCRLGFTVLRCKRKLSGDSNATCCSLTDKTDESEIDTEFSYPNNKDMQQKSSDTSDEQKSIFSIGEAEREELANGHAGHLWAEKNVRPLVMPKDAYSTAAVLSKLQVIKPCKVNNKDVDIIDVKKSAFQLDFDVYQTGVCIRKSDPGIPDYRVCVCRYEEPPPSREEITALLAASYPTPVKVAVVSTGAVNFYGLINADLPTLISLG